MSSDDDSDYLLDSEEDEDYDYNDYIVERVSNNYCDELKDAVDLQLKNKTFCSEVRQARGIFGLFKMFFSKEWMRSMVLWTNILLEAKASPRLTMPEFFVYLGIELFMSLTPQSRLTHYWRKDVAGPFGIIQEAMAKNRFLLIRGAMQFHPPNANLTRNYDCLWHSRAMLIEFVTNSSKVAVPVGAVALDECSIRCKGRTDAKSYNPAKPAKYAIRLFALVGGHTPYMFSCWDGGHGKKADTIPAVQQYLNAFGTLRIIYNTSVVPKAIVDRDSTSALWVMMMTHCIVANDDQDAQVRFFTDNFYTRHKVGLAVKVVTDGRGTLTGTMKYTNMILEDRVRVKEASFRVELQGRGKWLLVQAFERNNAGQLFVGRNAGYVVVMDKRPVIFYSNDLAKTPHPGFEGEESDHALDCVHGKAAIYRWTGQENIGRKKFAVPAMVNAYNKHMNGVDRFDQQRAVAPVLRREKRVSRSIFSFVLDACVQNAYAVSKKLGEEGLSWWGFKHMLATDLMNYQGQKSGSKKKSIYKNKVRFDELRKIHSNIKNKNNIMDGVESNHSNHFLLETIGHKPTPCFVCKLMDDSSTMRPILTCFGCKKGYHPSCFALFHCKQVSDANYAVLEKFHKKLSDRSNHEKLKMSANRCTIDKLDEIKLPEKRPRIKRVIGDEDDGGGKPRAKKRVKEDGGGKPRAKKRKMLPKASKK